MDNVTLSTLALEALAEGVLLVDSSGHIVYANRQAVQMFGHGSDHLVGRPFSAPIRTDTPVEISLPRPDTEPLVAEMQVVPLQSEEDTLSLVSLRDVTERLAAESRLREREELYRSVIEGAHEGFWVTDGKARILEVNDAYLRMTGYHHADLIGQSPSFVDADVDQDPAAVAERVRRVMVTGEDLFESRHRTRDGRIIDVEISLSYSPTADGRIFAFIRDITPRKRAEAAILASKATAEEANRAKSEFLAAMSHDLRTPLNAIIGFADLMRLETFGAIGNEKYLEYINNILASGELLISLVNDLLDLSKVEAGKYDLKDEMLDLAAVIEKSRNQTATMAESLGQQVVVSAPSTLPPLRADERALLQVFNNLLTNALKFNGDQERVDVTADRMSDGGVCVSVIDRGIGMSEAEIARALRPFEQVDSTHARRHKGTGLGLYLSVQIMRLLGGTLGIESTPKAGTVVTVTFPRERVASPLEEAGDRLLPTPSRGPRRPARN